MAEVLGNREALQRPGQLSGSYPPFELLGDQVFDDQLKGGLFRHFRYCLMEFDAVIPVSFGKVDGTPLVDIARNVGVADQVKRNRPDKIAGVATAYLGVKKEGVIFEAMSNPVADFIRRLIADLFFLVVF